MISRKIIFLFLVQSLLKQSYIVPGTPETDHDLRSIAEALFENLKDKNVTITHQRKTNKYDLINHQKRRKLFCIIN